MSSEQEKKDNQTDNLIGFITVVSVAALLAFFLGGQTVAAPFVWLGVSSLSALAWFFKAVISSFIQWIIAVVVLAGVAYLGKLYLAGNKKDEKEIL